jgi:hypothetical protein
VIDRPDCDCIVIKFKRDAVRTLPRQAGKVTTKATLTRRSEHDEAVTKVPTPPNPNDLKLAPARYAGSNPPFKEAQENALLAARSIFPEVDAFLASGKMHAQLAKCALLAHATPRGLAGFAQQGKEQEALINTLLNDEALTKQIMEMGGVYEGRYGQSMQIYSAIQEASEHARDGFLQRLALGCALEHPDGNVNEEGKTAVELMVAMYLNYEQAALHGQLDPAFNTYPDWEYRFIFPHRSVEDVTWLRNTMSNYRPDHIVLPDYKWRYVRIVRTDIPYTSNVQRPVRPDLGLTKMQDYFLEGGICGPRAFVGKLATASFGIPTRGARQTGHAAMSHWTPDGWTTVLGAHWTFNRWRGRCGLDFVLETKARACPEDFIKVLRSQWLGDAWGEGQVHGMTTAPAAACGMPWRSIESSRLSKMPRLRKSHSPARNSRNPTSKPPPRRLSRSR